MNMHESATERSTMHQSHLAMQLRDDNIQGIHNDSWKFHEICQPEYLTENTQSPTDE